MTLAELLLLLREGILNDRTDRISGTPDYLWSDALLTMYINEAERKFAADSLVLRDGSTDEVTRIELIAGQTIYPLHPSVLGVVSAKREDVQHDLVRVGHAFLNSYRPMEDTWVADTQYCTLPPGPTMAYSTDEEITDRDSDSRTQATLRVYPAPSADQDGQVIRLRVVRKPLDLLRLDVPSGRPEIPEDHHIEMLDWVAYLALRIVDDDAGAPRRAEEFRRMFEANTRAARAVAMRKMFTPLGWGFGRGGFSWEK